MTLKQISLTIPEVLFEASKEYSEKFGYRNIQELILDLMRKQITNKTLKRYKAIEQRMGKGIGVKSLNQKEAVKYLESL